MFSFLKRLFTESPSRKDFLFLVADRTDEVGKNRWYRLRHWKSPNFLRIETEWSSDWRNYESEEPVVGTSLEGREKAFLVLGDQPDFRILLKREPGNSRDKNAIMVIGSATVNGVRSIEQLGYLSRETAKRLKGEEDIDARPYSVFLPYEGRNLGLRVRVLVRSQAYLKKTGKATPKKKGRTTATPKRNIRKEVFSDVYDYFDEARQDYDCKKFSKTLFRPVFDEYFNESLEKRGLSEDEINKADLDVDSDLSYDVIDQIDEVIAKLFVIKPELEIQ